MLEDDREIEVSWDNNDDRREIEVSWDSNDDRREIEVSWDNNDDRREIEVFWDNNDDRREIEVSWDNNDDRREIEVSTVTKKIVDTLYYTSKKYTTSRQCHGFAKDDVISILRRLDYYTELLQIPVWRNKLHDSWVHIQCPFMIDNLSYATVYHYYHREKFALYPLFSYQFCIESNSLLSININVAISAGSSTGYFGKKQIRPDNIHPMLFSRTEKKRIRRKALFAKFSQIESLRHVLHCTRESVLVDRSTHIIDYDLMDIRTQLCQGTWKKKI
jgi:hypothetical protein